MDGNLALTTAAIEIVWLDLMLAGDGAMVLALATRALPHARRRLGLNLGGLVLMVLRAAILVAALACAPLPGFGFFAATALMFAAFLCARRGEAGPPALKSPTRSLPALLLAVVAQDAPVALTNMLAVQAAAQGHHALAGLGLGLSLPMLALGAAPFVGLLRKPPPLWAGALLLGWLAGQSVAADAFVALTPMPAAFLQDFAAPTGAALALFVVFITRRRLPEQES